MSTSHMSATVHNAHCNVKAKRTPVLCKMHDMEFDDRPEPAIRLEQARLARGFKTAKDAAAFFGWNYDTYAQHENGTRGITRAVGVYASAYKVSEGWLLTGEGRGPSAQAPEVPGLRRVVVAAHVQAGVWSESWEWDHSEQYDVYVPDEPQLKSIRLYGAETRGPSMNRRYPERTVLVFGNLQETMEQPIPGKRYIIERRRTDGTTEHTVKLLHMDADGKYWLVPESDDLRFQSPISVEDGTGEDDEVVIIGRVFFAVSRE